MKNKSELVVCIKQEIKERKDYLDTSKIDTIYFGGGTPSLLEKNELVGILNTIKQEFDINPEVEITLEANPDDLTKSKLEELKVCGINRLSIGIQSWMSTTWISIHRTSER